MAKQRKLNSLTLRILIEIVAMVTALVVILVMIGNVWASIAEGSKEKEEKKPVQTEPEETEPEDTTPPDTSPEGIMETFIAENGLSMADYPDFVLESYAIATESQDFLLNYPLKYGQTYEIDISGVDRSNGVPLFIQWDERWGYLDYGVSICGIGGCGPTCLSMVAYYLTGNAEYTPAYMLQYATDNKHVISTGGTDWSLFGTGAVELGFEVEQLPAVEKTIARRLEAGIPVVINVGPGTFTTTGHYMVLVGYEDGMFRINDPNSPEKSARLWSWDEFSSEVRNFWAISLPEE